VQRNSEFFTYRTIGTDGETEQWQRTVKRNSATEQRNGTMARTEHINSMHGQCGEIGRASMAHMTSGGQEIAKKNKYDRCSENIYRFCLGLDDHIS